SFPWSRGSVDSPTVLEGSYLVAARAVDVNGTSGPTRAITVTVNRRQPFPPTGVAAGWNLQVVEVQWSPNPEGDIIGYQVHRVDASGDTVVCGATAGSLVSTSCQDASPPNQASLQYYVVALDRAPDGSVRPGDHSATAT